MTSQLVYLRVPIIEVSRFLTVLISYLTMLLLIYVVIRYRLWKCNLVLNLSIPQHCVLRSYLYIFMSLSLICDLCGLELMY